MSVKNRNRSIRSMSPWRSAVAIVATALFAGADAHAQDFCACEGRQSLGSLATNDAASIAATGATNIAGSSDVIVTLPEDGVVVYDNLTVNNVQNNSRDARLVFTRAAGDTRNTPVTILVKGNVSVAGNDQIFVAGSDGGLGQTGSFGAGGRGGPGGFAGGDGAYQLVNLAADGGAGVGPGGGIGSVAEGRVPSAGGTLLSVPELRPLLGGSGGGGGHSTSTAFGCSAGGGGGGGGALLIAANGIIDVAGTITANGGAGGQRNNSSCSSSASGGSGGAIRLVAATIQGGGTISAAGGAAGCCGETGNGVSGNGGRIRMEAITNTFSANNTNPVAVRAPAPGPLANPITPTVSITSIDGNATPEHPVGFRNQIDLTVDAPGAIQIGLATQDVPAGTDVQLTVKPKVGPPPFSQNVTLAAGSCVSGSCVATTSVDLTPGAYILEARATFQVP